MYTLEDVMGRPVRSLEETARILGISQEDVVDLVVSGDLQAVGSNKQLVRSVDIMAFVYPECVKQKAATCTKMRLVEVLDEMIITKRGGVSGATADEYIYGAKHIKKAFPCTLISEILPRDVEIFFQNLKNPKTGLFYSEHTIQTIRKVFNMVFEYAYLNKYISERFPFKKLKLPQGILADKDSKFLEAVAVAQVLNCFNEHPFYYVLTKLMVALGLRINEALALDFRDFDRIKGVVKIRRAIKKGEMKENCAFTREKIIDLPKTHYSIRDIPAPVEVFDMVENWKRFAHRDKRFYGLCKELKTHNFLFVNKLGEIHTYNTLRRNYSKYLNSRKPTSINKVTFHMLRHTYGSLLLEQGVELKVVSERLGHKNISITADIYISVTKRLNQITNNACIDILHNINQLEKSIA